MEMVMGDCLNMMVVVPGSYLSKRAEVVLLEKNKSHYQKLVMLGHHLHMTMKKMVLMMMQVLNKMIMMEGLVLGWSNLLEPLWEK